MQYLVVEVLEVRLISRKSGGVRERKTAPTQQVVMWQIVHKSS